MGLKIQRRVTTKARVITTLIAVFALLVQPTYSFVAGQVANAASITIVAPGSMDGWVAADDNGHGGSLSFVNGPAGAHFGSGSAQLSVTASDQGYMLYKAGYGGTKLSNITALSYKTYVQQGNNTIAPALQFDIDKDVTDSNTSWQGRLVYEPYQNGHASVVDGQWQSQDALHGIWWLSSSSSLFSGNCSQASPCTLDTLISLYPNMGIRNVNGGGVGFKAGSSWTAFIGSIDNFVINGDTYDFEAHLPVNTASIQFVGGSKYVRESNTSDIDAQIVTYSATTAVNFYIDGSSTPVPGYRQGVASSGMDWWRLKSPLPAGQHTLTAKAQIYGDWYDVANTGIVYSLDQPWAQYVIPQANQFFRANDKVVRLKIDDQFDQFDHMVAVINGVSYTVNRADCVDQGNTIQCDLQNLNLPEGTFKASTTIYTKANNRLDNFISQLFTIDNTRPVLSHFQITNPSTAYTSHIDVSAVATDLSGVANVSYFVTTPRLVDSVCDGNGPKLLSAIADTQVGGAYVSSLNTTILGSGVYCVNAVAEDAADNHSNPVQSIKVTIDNTAPSIVLTSPANDAFVQGAVLTQSWSSTSNDIDHYIYESYNNEAMTSLRHHQDMGTQTSKSATGVGNATFWWRVKAVDHAGNETWSELRKLTIDNTAPQATVNIAGVGPTVTSFTVQFNEAVKKADAENAANYFLNNWKPDAGWSFSGPAGLTNQASVVYNEATHLATVTLPSGWYISGEQQWGVRDVSDLAGNVMTTPSSVYSTPMQAPVNLGAPNPVLSNDKATINWSWTAATDGIYTSGDTTQLGALTYHYTMTKDGLVVLTGDTSSTSLATPVTGDGVYKLVVTVSDLANNTSAPTEGAMTIDTLAPIVKITSSTQNSDGSWTFKGTTDDTTDVYVAISGVTTPYKATLTGTNWTVTTGTDLTAGLHTAMASSTDASGNASKVTADSEVDFTVVVETSQLSQDTVPGSTNAPRGARTDNTSTGGLIDPPTILGAQTAKDNGGVLGTSDKVAAIAPSAQGWKIFGVAWYWWVLIVAAVAAIMWWIIAAARRRSQNA